MIETKTKIFEKTFTIAWGDMDALGHVNNARYFDYFQEARIEWMKTVNLDLRHAEGPILIQTSATFLKPVVYPATLTIKCSVHSPGRSSFMMDYDLYQEEQLMTQGTSKIVWVDYQQNKSIPLPQKILDLFEASS